MKSFSTAAKAALEAGAVMTSAAVRIDASEPYLAWGGEGVLTLAGEGYIGVGDSMLVTATGAQLGGVEDGLEIALSGVDPTTIELGTSTFARNARVLIWRLMFDPTGTDLLHSEVFERGRVDKLTWSDTPGGTAVIKVAVETAARGLGRKTGRLTADADQRMIAATDGSLNRVTQAGELTLAWGGKPPARAIGALPTANQAVLDAALANFFGAQA